jgi:hypothetical protein
MIKIVLDFVYRTLTVWVKRGKLHHQFMIMDHMLGHPVKLLVIMEKNPAVLQRVQFPRLR